MKILGISAFYHDSACALIDRGELVSACQEERFSRKKHDPAFPIHSIQFCLKTVGEQNLATVCLSKEEESLAKQPIPDKEKSFYQKALKEIDYIAYYDKPLLSFERLLESYLDYAPGRGFSSFKQAMPLWLGGKINIRSLIKKKLKKHFSLPKKAVPEILFNYHHLSHAASAFYPSPFKEAAILCLDGVGEWATTSAWLGEGSHIQPLWQINFPHSLGLFYSTFTEYCGFKVNSGEYKLMGLAPYGEPTFVSLLKDHVIEIKEDGSFHLNMEYFNYPHSHCMASPALSHLLKQAPRGRQEQEIDIHYMNVASSAQKIIEEVLLKLCRSLYQETKIQQLCIAGGVALNCVANQRIVKESPFQFLWGQPAAGDAGGALGAAYSVWHEFLKQPRKVKTPDGMKGARLGPSYSSQEIEKILKREKAIYTKYIEKDIIFFVVEQLEKGKVVGWFQDSMEFGPRALGSRSILADARLEHIQKTMNQKIKFRESFRPFALSILEERVGDFFEKTNSPYMLLVSYILPAHRKNEQELRHSKGLQKQAIVKSPIPSCTHVDYSCRIQTVGKTASPRFRKLLEAFYQKTNCPGFINTSFNVRGEPIVCSPQEAYRCFCRTDMDICIIGDYILKKEEQKANFSD